MWLQSVQYDLQHDRAWVTDEADRSVVLALLQVAFLGKCDDRGLGPLGWPFSCPPDLVSDCRESGDYVLSTNHRFEFRPVRLLPLITLEVTRLDESAHQAYFIEM